MYLKRKIVNEWNSGDIHKWLIQINLEKYCDNFEMNHINGKNLFELSERDLIEEIKIIDVIDRKNLFKEIKLLRKIFPQNPIKSDYMKKKLVNFFEKNRAQFLPFNQNDTTSKKNYNKQDEESSSNMLSKEPAPANEIQKQKLKSIFQIVNQTHGHATIIHSKFGDTVDVQDTIVNKKDKSSDESGDSSSSSEDDKKNDSDDGRKDNDEVRKGIV